MSDSKTNYPDVLGYITRGTRKNYDAIECAISTRPDVVSAGTNFEAILLIQNMVDQPVDVHVTLSVPQRDVNKSKNVFFSKSLKLLVGLQPAEVGYAKIPVNCAVNTAPHDRYDISMTIQVKASKGAHNVRQKNHRVPFTEKSIANPEIISDLQTLRVLSFSDDDRHKRNQLFDTFAVEAPKGPASLSALQQEAGWVSLWTVHDFLDERTLIKRVQKELEVLLPQLRRETIFRPLIQKVQAGFENARYKLHVAEAIFITKLLTLVVELGATAINEGRDEAIPNWLQSIARLLIQEPRFATKPTYLITEQALNELVHDAIIYGFSMVGTVMNERYGTEDEMATYAQNVVDALQNGGNLNFAEVYLPLICAGVIANTRVTMPRENVRDTLHMLHEVVQQRKTEKTAENAFIFDTVASLIDRGLENF